MDHIVPISKGGQSTKNNVVPCCKTCNSEKKIPAAGGLAAPFRSR
ncbi:MAG: HNH endonuclease [Desulfobacterales bacterium]